jgi:hypothetical protein
VKKFVIAAQLPLVADDCLKENLKPRSSAGGPTPVRSQRPMRGNPSLFNREMEKFLQDGEAAISK